jgi:hypothetical protein
LAFWDRAIFRRFRVIIVAEYPLEKSTYLMQQALQDGDHAPTEKADPYDHGRDYQNGEYADYYSSARARG